MSYPGGPLKTDPAELDTTAARIEGHAAEFRSAQRAVRSRAGGVVLGSGQAASALPGLLAAWDAEAARLDALGRRHAEGHRRAAEAYERTDAEGSGWIGESGLNAGR